MKNKFKLIYVACIIALLSGCGSGNSSSSSSSQNTAPTGPISYQSIYNKFNLNDNSNQKTPLSNFLQGTSSGCGAVMVDAGTGISFASGFLNFVPTAGPLLGLLGVGAGSVLSLFGSENGNNCVAQEFQNIENQLFVQEQQINQIESNLSLSSNFIWNSIATNAGNIAYDGYNAFTTSLADINGNGGALEYIYSAAGFYNSDAGALTSETLAQLVSNPTNFAATA